MVENDFTGIKKFFFFFAKVTPKRVWFWTKNAENFPKIFFYQVPNRDIKSDEISASHDRF